MAYFGDLEDLENLHRDLLAQSEHRVASIDGDLLADAEQRLPNIERLWIQLEARIDEFRHLLEKSPRNDGSRKSLQSGTRFPFDFYFIADQAHIREDTDSRRRIHCQRGLPARHTATSGRAELGRVTVRPNILRSSERC